MDKLPEQGKHRVMTSFAQGLVKQMDENNVEQE